MGKRNTAERHQIKMTSIDELILNDHLIRKIDAAIDLNFIYDKAKELYSPYGKESIDPVVLIKIVMIQYIFGIKSMRQTIKEIEVNIAYRWYLGYGLNESIPYFSTFWKNYSRRFEGTELFEDIFKAIINEATKYGFIDETTIFIDGTHIKANANNHKCKNEVIEKSVKFYEEALKEEISKDREEHGKSPLKEKNTNETKTIKVSITDLECGVFHKGEHKKVFAYTSNTACDINNYILGFNVSLGNTHDSVAFPSLYSKLTKEYENIKRLMKNLTFHKPFVFNLRVKAL